MRISRTAGILFALAAFGLGAAAVPFPRLLPDRQTEPPRSPGPLSASHAERPGNDDCEACHVSPGEVPPANCLACHEEIATRIEEGRGYHRDKADGCGTCHAEHQGPDADLTPLDPGDFDHAETGFVLDGGHSRIKDCRSCHEGAGALRRGAGTSYLLRDAWCSSCHISPHPGRQEECLACHSTDGWRSP